MSKKNLLIAFIIILLSLLWLLVPVTSCSAAEPEKVYTITATELTNLEVELNRAQRAIENSKVKSTELQQQLIKLQTALTEAKQQSATLREQLKASTVTLTLQQTQLESANESLEMLNKEVRQEQKNLKRQRDIAYIVAVACLYIAVR